MKELLCVYDLMYNQVCILNDNTINSATHITEDFNLNSVNKITFNLPLTSNKWQYLLNENLVKWKNEFYFIKVPKYSHSQDNSKSITVECRHLSSNLEGMLSPEFELIGQTATSLMNSVLTGSNWSLGEIDIINTKCRSLITKEQSIFNNLIKIAELYNAQITFNSTTKKVNIYEHETDRNIIIRKNKNLKSIDLEYDTNEMVTKLYAFGGRDETTDLDIDIMGVNPTGKSYILDYSYYLNQGYTQVYIDAHPELFLKESTWNATEYTDAQTLYDDALKKLTILAQPKVKCHIECLDLNSYQQYFMDTPIVGEVLTIVDEDLNLNLKAKIISIKRDNDNPLAISIDISNEVEYNSLVKQLVDTTTAMNRNMNSKGEVDGSKLYGTIDGNTVKITNLDVSNFTVGTIDANTIDVINLDARNITTGYIDANVIDVQNLNASNISAGYVKADFLDATEIQTSLLNSKIITAESGIIDNLAVTNGHIGNLDAGKIDTGTLNAGRIGATSITADKFSTQPYGVNIIKNSDGSSYSTGTYGDDFTYWTKTVTSTGYVKRKDVVFIDGGTVPVFSFIDTDATNTKIISLFSDKIEINPNKTYVLEGWIQRTTTNGTSYIGFEQTDSNDVDIDGNGGYIASSVSPTVGVWTYYSGYIYPAQTQAKLTVAYNYATDTTVTVDSTNGFGTSGTAYIGDKYFNYTNKTTTQFTGVTNGNFTTNQSVGTIVGLRNAPTSSNATTGLDYQFQSKYTKYIRIKLYGAYNSTGTAEHYLYGIALREVGGTTVYGDTILTGSITADRLMAKTITATSGVLDDACIGNAQIDRVTANKLVVNTADINALAVKTAQIDDNAVTNSKIDRLSVNKLQVTNADIDRLSVNKIKIQDGDIDRLTANRVKIQDADIDRVSANKLKVVTADIDALAVTSAKIGSLDGNIANITNLKADSIVAGALTIDGMNMIHESDFRDITTWSLGTGWVLDTTTKYDTSNTVKISRTGLSSDNNKWILSEKVPITEGQRLVASIYFKTDNVAGIDGTDPDIDICYFNSSDTFLSEHMVSIKPTTNNTWQRGITNLQAPVGTAYARLSVDIYRNGTLWVARPMLQRGSISSEWKLHIDELISDGAITGDKIADNTITGGNIVQFSITANEIKGGTITSDKIGAKEIKTENLATDSITADKIKAGEVKANKLDILGLSVKNVAGQETLNIRSDGSISMAGEVKSSNYNSTTKAGWKISNDGNADFYDATIRGDLLLPNAGMTNRYDSSQVYGRNLLLNSLTNTSGTTYKIGDFTMSKDIVAGNVYTCVLEGTKQATQTFGLWQNAGSLGKGDFTQISNSNRWYLTFTASATTTGNERKISIYNPPSSTSAWTLGWIALYEGSDVINDWCPAPEDNLNPVRIWAGTDYIARETAPFRVYQDGSIVANQGTFSGTLSGRVDIGNIHIADTNTTNASFKMNSNGDASTIIKFEETSSFINTEFIIGNDSTKYFYVNGSAKTSFMQDTAFKIGQSATNNNVNFPNTSTGNLVEFVDGSHFIKYDTTSKALQFKTTANSPSEDFLFVRYDKTSGTDVATDVSVKIDGDLTVTNKVVMGNVTIQKKADGIDFIIV